MNRHEIELLSFDDPEKALEYFEELKKNQKRSGGVCICGHSMKAHLGDPVVCAPGRMFCPCKVPREVIQTSNLRPFMKKTQGASALHALGQGMHGALSRDAKIEWVVDQSCDRCGSTDSVVPAAIDTYNGKVAGEATGVDKLICKKCYIELGSTAGLA